MSERYAATKIIAAGAVGCAVLAGCGTEHAGQPTHDLTPPTASASSEPTITGTKKPTHDVSPSALPREILSGKGQALVCRGLVVMQVPEGFRTVANPIIDTSSKQVLFVENFSKAGITVDTERDSNQAPSWYDLQGNPKTLAELPCDEQTLYTHRVTEPQGNHAYVVTTSAHEFSGETRLDLHALQGTDGLVGHDFGIEGEVGMTQRLEQLQGQNP